MGDGSQVTPHGKVQVIGMPCSSFADVQRIGTMQMYLNVRVCVLEYIHNLGEEIPGRGSQMHNVQMHSRLALQQLFLGFFQNGYHSFCILKKNLSGGGQFHSPGISDKKGGV
jgi:hypothetical protein